MKNRKKEGTDEREIKRTEQRSRGRGGFKRDWHNGLFSNIIEDRFHMQNCGLHHQLNPMWTNGEYKWNNDVNGFSAPFSQKQ